MASAPKVTVTGVIESGDVDCFRLQRRRGERLAAEVEAIRLGGSLFDAVLTILGPDGKPLASVDDTPLFRQDPFATIVAPVDGVYTIQVRESSFEGDESSRYALHVGAFPRPPFVYPAGGRAGQAMSVQFGGDAAGEFENETKLPAGLQGDWPLFASQQGLTSPTGNPFRVSPCDNVLEREPNDNSSAGGAAARLPVAFNGMLQRAGDSDHFRFLSPAGAAWVFEAFAERLGSPADTVLTIFDERGSVIAANDDGESHDSRLTFHAPSEGEYVLRVTDKRGAGGVGWVYRVEVSEALPSLHAFMPRPNRMSQERQAVAVPRGNRVVALLGVQRAGVSGEVRLDAEGLPPGVAASETRLPSDQFWQPVVFEAASDAPLGGSLTGLKASGTVDGKPIAGSFVQTVDLVAGSADTLFHAVTV